MLYQFTHKVLHGFYLWFEKQLLDSSVKAYSTNKSNSFNYVESVDAAGSWLSYQGDYRQLVADENVDVPNSGVFIDGVFTSGDSPDIYIDYNDGRVIVPQASGQSLTITANSTVKEVNTYIVNESPESILLHSDFVVQGAEAAPYLNTQENKRNDKVYIVPACFISIESSDNSPLCFGGEDETEVRVRVFVVTDDNYTRDGILSIFADKERSNITLLADKTDFPYGAFFSLKSYPYNYDTLSAAQPDTSVNTAYIKNVIASKVTQDISDDYNKNLLFAFLDFDLVTARFPRL